MPAACAVVFASSFCTMLIELAASRLLAPHVGVSLFSWTGIIGVVLAGVAVGNFVGGRVADRWPRPAVLGLCLFLGGVASLAIPLLLAPATAQPFLGIPGLPDLRALGLMPRIVALAATLFFVPVLLLGTISPQVIRLAITDLGHAGRTAGRIYAWSTAGAIVGTFAAGWALISLLGVNLLIALAGLGLMTLALVVGLWRGRPAAALAGGVGLAVAGIVGLALLPRLDVDGNPALRPLRSLVTSGCTQETNYFCIRTYFQPEKDGGVMVLVLDHLVHSYVKVNDPSYLGYEHEQVQVDLTHLAAARAGERPNILLIGGGGYTYPRWVEAFVPGAAIDVVEIDPGVTETAYRDLGLKPDTRIRSYNLDGRQFVQEMAPKGSYQLVVQDAVNDLSVPYHIMTKEYNDRVKQIMTDDGVYLLSVIDLYRDGQLMRSSLRTLMQTFKEVRLLAVTPTWSTGGAARLCHLRVGPPVRSGGGAGGGARPRRDREDGGAAGRRDARLRRRWAADHPDRPVRAGRQPHQHPVQPPQRLICSLRDPSPGAQPASDSWHWRLSAGLRRSRFNRVARVALMTAVVAKVWGWSARMSLGLSPSTR